MRREILLHQASRKTIGSLPDPMRTMQLCQGLCEQVPDEVDEAVFDTFLQIQGVSGETQERETLAAIIAPRMALDGWRFCPCFPEKRTEHHAQIFAMVHTNMANRLAHRALLELGLNDDKRSAN